MINVVTAGTVVSYAVYAISPETVEKFDTKYLIFTMPFVLFGIFRYLYLIYQRPSERNPTEAILGDKPFLINILLWVASVVWVVYRDLAAELVSARRGTAALYTEVLRAERGLRESAARAATARARLIEARTRVQALERLRQRAREAYVGEFRRLEQMELDEVGSRVATGRRSAP